MAEERKDHPQKHKLYQLEKQVEGNQIPNSPALTDLLEVKEL